MLSLNILSVDSVCAFLTVAGGGENGKEVAGIVRDAHFAERQMAMVDQLMRFGSDDAGACSANECDIGRRCNGEVAMTVGSSSKCEVGQREEDTTLPAAARIQLARLYANLRPGIAFGNLNYFYSVLSCKLVVEEEILQGLHVCPFHESNEFV